MGWSYGIVDGREVGYGVDAECDVPGCGEVIDRGLAYRCGSAENLINGSPGCGAYVCDRHNFMGTCEVCDPPSGEVS